MSSFRIACAIVLFAAVVFLGCVRKPQHQGEKYLIITTIYPYELIIRELTDTLATFKTLIPPNASPHTWSPGPQDIAGLQQADLVISNGLGLETNLARTLAGLGSKHVCAADLPGMAELINTHMNITAEQENHEGHSHQGTNPHIWTSPELLIRIVSGLESELARRIPKHAGFMAPRANAMIDSLKQVNLRIRSERERLKEPAVITLHNAFEYFFDHFDILFLGAVQPSAGKDPAPQQLKQLADKVRKHQIKTIFIEPGLNPKPAETLAKELNLQIRQYDDLGTTLQAKTIADYLWQNWLLIKAGL